EMDRGYRQFFVYHEVDSGVNHYYPSLWLNGDTNMCFTTNCRQRPHSGTSCIRIKWDGKPGRDGFRWNGVRVHDSPTATGGPGKGVGVAGGGWVGVWVGGETPGLRVKLLVGSPQDRCGEIGDWTKPNELTADWKPFEIDLRGRGVSLLTAGFTIVFSEEFV